MSKASLLCIFGTSSDVGKSWISAGLCRLFYQSGISVTPYKAQNMSNNAGVTQEGLEMGRAQIVQAYAAGLVPHVDMNPLLLKPNTEVGAQVIALGKILGTMSARAYFRGDMDRRRTLVLEALDGRRVWDAAAARWLEQWWGLPRLVRARKRGVLSSRYRSLQLSSELG